MADRSLRPALDPRFDPLRAAAAGAAASLVYLGVMYADMAITGSPSDDLLLVGRPLAADAGRARLLGFLGHMGFGTGMGLLYGGAVQRRLSGPSYVRGVTMMLAENALLWPLTFVADRFHPAMRDGQIPRLNAPIPCAQQIVRHVAFGAVLGSLYGAGSPRVEPPER